MRKLAEGLLEKNPACKGRQEESLTQKTIVGQGDQSAAHNQEIQ